MSLKAVHIIFITFATLLTLGFGGWSFYNYSSTRATADLVFGISSVVGGLALLWYGKYFLKKLKNISYL